MDMSLLLPYPDQINEDDNFEQYGTTLSGFNASAWHLAMWGCKWNIVFAEVIVCNDTDIEVNYETSNNSNREWVSALIRYGFGIDFLDKTDLSVNYLYSSWILNMGGKISSYYNAKQKQHGYKSWKYDDYLEYLKENNPEHYEVAKKEREEMSERGLQFTKDHINARKKEIKPTAKQLALAEKYLAVATPDKNDFLFYDVDGVTVNLDHADGVTMITEELIEELKKEK
jgi:hypothetical protein